MASIQIIITPDADDDIREIYDYLSNYSMNAALGQIDVLLEKFELLKQFPRLGETIGTLNNERLREFYVVNIALPITSYLIIRLTSFASTTLPDHQVLNSTFLLP